MPSAHRDAPRSAAGRGEQTRHRAPAWNVAFPCTWTNLRMGRSCGQVLGEDPVVETFHVYVVGAEDRSNAGLAAVAEAIAEHYGLPADDLLGRLSRGRFRVKTGVDRATADQYQRDLDKLGARVSIEPASPMDRPSGTSLPPPNTSRTTTP